MLLKLQIFLFVLSGLYWIVFFMRLIILFKEENPEPMSITKADKVFLYLSASYILTGIIMLFI